MSRLVTTNVGSFPTKFIFITKNEVVRTNGLSGTVLLYFSVRHSYFLYLKIIEIKTVDITQL